MKDVKLRLNYIARTINTLEMTVSENNKILDRLAPITISLKSDEQVMKSLSTVRSDIETKRDDGKVEVALFEERGGGGGCDREDPRSTQEISYDAPIGQQRDIGQTDSRSTQDDYRKNFNTVSEITDSRNEDIMKDTNDSNEADNGDNNENSNESLGDVSVSNIVNYFDETQKKQYREKGVLSENRCEEPDDDHIEETWERVILAEMFRNKLEVICSRRSDDHNDKYSNVEYDGLGIPNKIDPNNENKNSFDGHGQADAISSGELYTRYVNINFGAKLSSR